MSKKFIAMVLSASLALTSITVTPARADDDVGKVLAGSAALLVIGAAVKKNKHRKENQNVTRQVQPETWSPAPKKRRHAKKAPQRCLRNQWTHRGNREVYGARCMQRHANAQLPNRCLRHAEVNQGPRRFYTKRCLRKNG
jgi:hypothetical protein